MAERGRPNDDDVQEIVPIVKSEPRDSAPQGNDQTSRNMTMYEGSNQVNENMLATMEIEHYDEGVYSEEYDGQYVDEAYGGQFVSSHETGGAGKIFSPTLI